MADLIAIGYPDLQTAEQAEAELERLAQELVIEPESIAIISRDEQGKFHVRTTHHEVATGATWGMLWGVLFGFLFFVPLLGLAVGAGLGALFGLVAKLDISAEFQRQVREMLQPGTAAVFVIVDKMTTDKLIEAISKFHGTVLKTSLPRDIEQQLQESLTGSAVGVGA
ncbi:MAG TPA: DUF1269 domain-containing protein [Acidimicrobiales bacterium]|jgi:uncharacterized membrane protein|nr:DUF1269 domain-containing protein [Acidimicrobiales bacterium]